jgi:hypothetical protein
MENNEIKKTDEKKEEVTVPKNPQVVGDAFRAAEELRLENARMAENISRLEQLKAFEVLGGRSEGRQQEVPKKEISEEEYASMAMRGIIPTS